MNALAGEPRRHAMNVERLIVARANRSGLRCDVVRARSSRRAHSMQHFCISVAAPTPSANQLETPR